MAVNSLLNGDQGMNKFLSVLVLGSALALSACGGDSDSSGGSYTGTVKPTPTKAAETSAKSAPNKSYDQPNSSSNLSLHFVLGSVVLLSWSVLH